MANFAGVTTLLDVRTSCKQQSDNVNQAFLSDSEWDALIGAAYQELYGRIVQAFGNDYFVQTPALQFTFVTDGVNDHYALPSGVTDGPDDPHQVFFKLLGVDLKLTATQWVTVKPFAMMDRNRYSSIGTGVPAAGQTVRVLYVPRLVLPTLDDDKIDGVNGWEDWIVCRACMIALAKEESDVSVFKFRLKQLEDRLDSEIENRDAGSPACIVDSMTQGDVGMRYRLNGNNLWVIGNGLPAYGVFPWGW